MSIMTSSEQNMCNHSNGEVHNIGTCPCLTQQLKNTSTSHHFSISYNASKYQKELNFDCAY